MKRLIMLLCCAAVLTTAGCAQSAKPSNQIEVWHWMTDRHEALELLAHQYQQLTGITVKIELFPPSDAYTQKIIAAAQANVLPEIYGILDKKAIVASFIKAGYVADLTADFEADNHAWENSFFPHALDVNRFGPNNSNGVKPGIYGVPLDVTTMQMLYNKTLLKKAGILKVPSTFDEFLTAIEALRRVGITPFVSGFGEMWLVDCFASNYAFNILGEDLVMKTYRGDMKYTDPGWLKVFGVFKALAEKNAFMEGIVTKGNKYAEQDFALERAAFAFNGSWGVNVYREMNPNLDYGVTSLPPVNIFAPMRSWGGAGSSFVVNKSSSKRDKAIAFLKWVTAKEQQSFLSEKTYNLPSNKEAVLARPTVLSDFARAMSNTTHPSIWPVNEDPVVIEVFDKVLQAIIIGEKTPEAAAQEVQRVKDRQMQKAGRS